MPSSDQRETPSPSMGTPVTTLDVLDEETEITQVSKPPGPRSDSGRGIDGPVPDFMDEVGPDRTGGSVSSLPPEFPLASRFTPASPSNYHAWTSPTPRVISKLVIHITDGGTDINGTVAWFQDPSAQVSAHYVIGQDGEIVQMVHHADVAWHAHTANSESIGIEHLSRSPKERGPADPGFFPTHAQYCSSAMLVRWLCQRFNLPPDRVHIVGHTEADPHTTHTDCPNGVWDWNFYMGLVTSTWPAHGG